MNIYLPIEVKVRELEGKMLLALIAAERGHTVIIGEKKDTLHLAKSGHLPPGIVHDKSLTPGDYKIKDFIMLKDHGHLITAQDEESGLLDESFDHFAKRRFSEETVSRVDKIFAWGKHDAESLKKIYPEYSEKVVTTGSPRVDFWRKEFDAFYRKDQNGLKPDVLIASNFGYPIDENPFWNRIARLRKAGYFERDPAMERYMYENSAYQYRLLYCFVEMIRALSKSFPGIQILVRPHPVESIDTWHKLVGEIPNVTIQREGTISGWIRNASVLIHNGCTSALEASVSGMPRIAYRPIPHELEREIPNNTSVHAFSYDELKKMVADILENGKTEGTDEAEKLTAEILSSRFSSLTGKLATEKIVNEWIALGESAGLNHSTMTDLIEIKSKRIKELKNENFKRNLKRKAVDIRNFILRQSRPENKNSNLLKTGHKFPYLNDDEVDKIVSDLQSSINRFHDLTIRRFGEKSFILSKKKS